VLALALARDIADFGAPDYTRSDLESEWDAESITLTDDARIGVRDDGTLAGYAILRRSEALVIVDPGTVDEGVGRALLQWSERRERELGRTHHRRAVAATDTRGQALLRDAGYVLARSFWRLSRPLHAPVGPAVIPAGISLRALDTERDGAAVHALDERSFAGSPDFTPHTAAEFSYEHLQAADLAPELSLVAEQHGVMVAFLLSHRRVQENAGYVDILAVSPEQRGRGLGQALLATAFAGYRTDGLELAELGVASDNPRALRLYARVGMAPRFQIDSFVRDAG